MANVAQLIHALTVCLKCALCTHHWLLGDLLRIFLIFFTFFSTFFIFADFVVVFFVFFFFFTYSVWQFTPNYTFPHTYCVVHSNTSKQCVRCTSLRQYISLWHDWNKSIKSMINVHLYRQTYIFVQFQIQKVPIRDGHLIKSLKNLISNVNRSWNCGTIFVCLIFSICSERLKIYFGYLFLYRYFGSYRQFGTYRTLWRTRWKMHRRP